MTVVEAGSKDKLLDIIATAVTVIGEGVSAGPFENADEMKKTLEKLKVDGYDGVGEKSDKVSK